MIGPFFDIFCDFVDRLWQCVGRLSLLGFTGYSFSGWTFAGSVFVWFVALSSLFNLR